MSISAKELQSRLEAWSKTPAGKKRIKDDLNAIRSSGGKLASGDEILTTGKMEALAAEIMTMIESRLPDSISDVGMHSHSAQKTADGDYYVDVFFNEQNLSRESLENDYQTYTGDGIENIVALFNNGMDAKDFAYGWWNDHAPSGEALGRSMPGDKCAWVRSVKHRDPLLFMQAAVDEFNAKYFCKLSA